MANLKEEFLCELEGQGKTINDIKFVSCLGYLVTNSVEDILNLMKDVNYEDGSYDYPKVRDDVTVVGDSWWMELRIDEDDYGAYTVYWQYHELPKKPKKTVVIKSFGSREDVEELMDDEELPPHLLAILGE